MISSKVETKLTQLFKAIAESETEIEKLRQSLAEKHDFEPYAAFKRIDSSGLGYITITDLHQFLKDNNVFASEEDMHVIFHQLDSDRDQRMTYADFISAILTATNYHLRQLVTQRKPSPIDGNNPLPLHVEDLIAKIFEKEMDTSNKIEFLKEDLSDDRDFDNIRMFRAADVNNCGYLEQKGLEAFFKKNGWFATEGDLAALFHRIDKDRDGKVSFAEFVDTVTPIASTKVHRSKSPQRSSVQSIAVSVANSKAVSLANSKAASPRGYSMLLDSSNKTATLPHKRPGSPSKPFLATQKKSSYQHSINETVSKRLFQRETSVRSDVLKTPKRSQMINKEESYRSSPRRMSLKTSPRSPRRQSPLRGDEEEHLAKVLRNETELDRDIEKLRNELIFRSDFNLLDAFKLFDVNGRGFITSREFEMGLKELGVYPTKDEIFLVMKKFDKDEDGRLRYSEFTEIFAPRNDESARPLINRIPSYLMTSDASMLFNLKTRKILQRFFTFLFQNEAIIEDIRKRLSKRPLFDVYDAFKALDINDNGFITVNEFKQVLADHEIYLKSNELLMLIRRFDKDQDGRVSFMEFLSEITPQSPSKYRFI